MNQKCIFTCSPLENIMRIDLHLRCGLRVNVPRHFRVSNEIFTRPKCKDDLENKTFPTPRSHKQNSFFFRKSVLTCNMLLGWQDG